MFESHEKPVDFSSLDPTIDQLRFSRAVRAIMDEARDELHRRQRRQSPVLTLGDWWRPMLAAAAITVMVTASVWRWMPPDPASSSTGIAEAIGVPEVLAQSLRDGEIPAAFEILYALEDIRE